MNSVKVTLRVSNTLHLLPSPTWDPSSGPVMSRALISQKEMATGYCSGQYSSVCAQSSGMSSANTHTGSSARTWAHHTCTQTWSPKLELPLVDSVVL